MAMIRTLVAQGADIEAEDAGGRRPLHAAVQGHADAVRVLVELHADVEAEDAGGTRPLHFAAADGHVETMKTLVEMQADIEERMLKAGGRWTGRHTRGTWRRQERC